MEAWKIYFQKHKQTKIESGKRKKNHKKSCILTWLQSVSPTTPLVPFWVIRSGASLLVSTLSSSVFASFPSWQATHNHSDAQVSQQCYGLPCVCLVTQSCPTLWDPMDCSPPGSSIRGIFQARVLEWVAMPSSRGSYKPRDQTQVSCIAGGSFTSQATREAVVCPTKC